MSVKSSESSKRDTLRAFLKKYADGRYRNSVVEFLPDNGTYLIFVQGDVQPFTTKAKTMFERRAMSDLGIPVQIAQFSNKTDALTSAALCQVLEPLLGGNLIEVGVSTPTPETAEVLVFVHDTATADMEELRERVVAKTVEFLKPYELHLQRFYFNELADGVPSAFQILRVVYTHAPIKLETLSEKLSSEQTPVPSEAWLKRQLDALVRKRLIIWQKPGIYVATAEGIAALPPRKGRTSPDIARALAFGRKIW